MEPNWKNKTLFLGDNLHIMRRMNSSLMDLIYADPPFNSGRQYRAPIGSSGELKVVFEDYWREEDLDQLEHALLAQYTDDEGISLFSKARYHGFNALYSVISSSRAAHGKSMFCYLIMMAMRLIECRRLLKETGSIYLHCDPTASHYLKLVMDAIFGPKNFRNEIIWCYQLYAKGFKSNNKYCLPRNHDCILWYAKSANHVIREKPHVMVDLETDPQYFKKDEHGWYSTRPYNDNEDLSKFPEHCIYSTSSGSTRIKRYVSNPYPKPLGCTWTDILDMTYHKSEVCGYPTQKPLPLLERIIKASSNPGDRVFDPFCGCATTLVAAEKLDRQWIGIDISPQAEVEIQKRMRKLSIDRGEDELAIWKASIPST